MSQFCGSFWALTKRSLLTVIVYWAAIAPAPSNANTTASRANLIDRTPWKGVDVTLHELGERLNLKSEASIYAAPERKNFEIGRILHLKSRNPKSQVGQARISASPN